MENTLPPTASAGYPIGVPGPAGSIQRKVPPYFDPVGGGVVTVDTGFVVTGAVPVGAVVTGVVAAVVAAVVAGVVVPPPQPVIISAAASKRIRGNNNFFMLTSLN